jgi:hypothetical protein
LYNIAISGLRLGDTMGKRKIVYLLALVMTFGMAGCMLAGKEKTPSVETVQHSKYPGVYLFEKNTEIKIHTPEEFGADGFDDKPDTAALQKAIDNSDIVILKSGAVYKIYRSLFSRNSIRLESDNPSGKKPVILQMNQLNAFIVDNIAVASTKVSEPIKKGDPYITLADTSRLKPGDLLHLLSTKLWDWENRGYLKKGELHKISKIDGYNVYLERAASDDYPLSGGEEVTVRAYPDVSVDISNIAFSHPKLFQTTMVKINQTSKARFENISIRNSQQVGLYLNRTYQTEVKHAEIELGTTGDINTGYGIQDYGGTGTVITDSIFKRVRRGVDFSGVTPSRYGTVVNSKAYGYKQGTLAGGNSGFGTHSTAEEITFTNNYIENFNYAFLSRGNNIFITDNQLEGFSRNFAAISYGGHVEVKNNTYKSKQGSQLNSFIKLFDSYSGSINVSGNTSNRLNGPFIDGNLGHLNSAQVNGNHIIK